MKRLFAVFTLCATTLIAASAVSSPVAADGRHDGRRYSAQSDRQTSPYFAYRGDQRRGFRDHRDRRHHKVRRSQKRHRHAQSHRRGHRHGYGYGRRYYRHGYRMGSALAFSFDGGHAIFRLD